MPNRSPGRTPRQDAHRVSGTFAKPRNEPLTRRENRTAHENAEGLGKGQDFQIVEEYEVDTGTIREIRAVQQQVAEELGQRVQKVETLDMNKLWERMTDEELSRYVTHGKVPGWYQAAPDNPSGVKTEVTATEAKGTGGDDVR